MKQGHLDLLKNENVRNGQIKMPDFEILFCCSLKMLITKLFKHTQVHVKKYCRQSWINVTQHLYSHMWFIAVFVRLWMGHILVEI